MLSFSACTRNTEPKKFKNPIFNQPLNGNIVGEDVFVHITPFSYQITGPKTKKNMLCSLVEDKNTQITLNCPTADGKDYFIQLINIGTDTDEAHQKLKEIYEEHAQKYIPKCKIIEKIYLKKKDIQQEKTHTENLLYTVLSEKNGCFDVDQNILFPILPF